MSDFTIDFEWLDPLGARGPELRATWARLAILVGGNSVTRVYDDQSKTVRDAVYLPLYPLAEWLAGQWWPLWNEPGPSASPDRSGYEARHSLVSAREGYALPPLRIEPAGSVVLLSWSAERLPAHRLEFPGQGEFWADTKTVKRGFSELINAVANRLESQGITDSLLQQDWTAIGAADEDETIFCECVGALGLDPYSLDDRQEEEIESAGRRLPEEIVTEFFRAAHRGELAAEADEIRGAVERTRGNKENLAKLKDLRLIVAPGGEPAQATPWEQGYSVAQRLRAYLGLDGEPLNSIEKIASTVGITEADLERVLSSFSDKAIPFAALMGMNEDLSPAFVLRPARTESLLFHFCRALFEYLCSPPQRSALVTNANSEQQKRNRAFAAELLAPSSALRSRVKAPIVSGEETEELAEVFGVSSYIVSHQLLNHGIARVEQT